MRFATNEQEGLRVILGLSWHDKRTMMCLRDQQNLHKLE